MFFCTPSIVVADEAALNQMWDVKGASGAVPCIHCSNVVHLIHKRSRGDAVELITICCTDISAFRVRTDEAAFKAAEHLVNQMGIVTQGRLQDMETSMGMNCNPQGLLAKRVMGTSSTMFDFMHVYLVNGVLHVEVNELLSKLSTMRVNADSIHEFISGLEFPQAAGHKKRDVLSLFRKPLAKGDFKAAASQCLDVYPLLRHMLLSRTDVQERLRDETKSFLALADVMDYLCLGNRGSFIRADHLQRLIMSHCNLFLKAYGENPVVHKFHMTMHLPMQLQKFGLLISCFTQERKHKHVK